jgi:transposase InsO family protein
MRIRELAQARPRFGYVRIWILLRRDNKKRAHRLYRLEGLQVRMRGRRTKRLSLYRGVVPPAAGRNQHWGMDFVYDHLVTGRAFRVLTVIDQWSVLVAGQPGARPHLARLAFEYLEIGEVTPDAEWAVPGAFTKTNR